MGGPGIDDQGRYDCKALQDWDFTFQDAGEISHADKGIHQPRVVWKKRSGNDDDGQTEMPESVLMDTELLLLETSKKVEDYVMSLPKPKQPKASRRRSKR